jgi:ribosomal protein S15P/S13E
MAHLGHVERHEQDVSSDDGLDIISTTRKGLADKGTGTYPKGDNGSKGKA